MLGHKLKVLGHAPLCAGRAWLRHWKAPRRMAGEELDFQVPRVSECVTYSPIPFSDQDSYKFVVFDLETTGLGWNAEICQIAAAELKSNAPVWSKYILPESSIDDSASVFHGITIKMIGGKQCLLNEGKPVEALDLEDAMPPFLAYLQEQSYDVSKTILIAHNAFLFDVPILLYSLDKCGIKAEQLDALGVGFADSLRLLKELKAQKCSLLLSEGKPISLSLPTVYQHLFKEEEPKDEGGKGVKDVQTLCSILSYKPLAITPAQLLEHSTTTMSAWKRIKFQERKYERLLTLNPLYLPIDGKCVISRYIAEKIAESGLSFSDLEQIYLRHGRNGIASVFAALRSSLKPGQIYPQARVTRVRRIIDAVADYFQGRQN